MPLILPRVVVPREVGAVVEVSRSDATSAAELDHLERLSCAEWPGEHFLPLAHRRFAVGRTDAIGTRWRIGTEDDVARLSHPAWLWRLDEVFDPDQGDSVDVAPAIPLRTLIKGAVPLFGSVAITCKCLAAAIAALRRRKRAVAVVPAAIQSPEAAVEPARSFVLALLTALPPVWRAQLRVSTLRHDPEPSAWDLVITTGTARGFTAIHTDLPPDVDDDLVAAYILDRLLHRDPESVEAAAFRWKDGADDPWGEGIQEWLAAGVPGLTEITADQLERDPQGAVAAVCRRLQAGAALRGMVLSELALVSAKTSDPRPWLLVAERESGERSRAMLAVLPHLDPAVAGEPLVRALDAIVSPATLGAWAGFLVHRIRTTDDPAYVLQRLSELLGARGTPLDAATRASLWQEVTVALVERHESFLAAGELLSAAGRRIAAEGGVLAMVHGFLALPAATRTPGALRAVVEAASHSDKPDIAVATLWRGLPSRGADEDAPSPRRLVLQAWARARTRADAPELPSDALLLALRDEPDALAWATIIAPIAARGRLPALLREARPRDPTASDAYYRAAELARTDALHLDARARFADLALYLPEAGPLVDELARELLLDVLPGAAFPAADLSETAIELAEQPDASTFWAWIALAAHEPGTLGSDTIDATVVSVGETPPDREQDRVQCQRAAAALAGSDRWGPFDLARWVVRLISAPDGDGTLFCLALAHQILRAVTRRADGLMVITQLSREFLQLPPDHPALRVFLARLLPYAWNGPPPPAYLAAIREARIGAGARRLWHEAMGIEDDR